MPFNVDRGLVMQAVMEGQIGAEHVTVDEIVTAYHLLADTAIQQAVQEIIHAHPDNQARVFDLPWQYLLPN